MMMIKQYVQKAIRYVMPLIFLFFVLMVGLFVGTKQVYADTYSPPQFFDYCSNQSCYDCANFTGVSYNNITTDYTINYGNGTCADHYTYSGITYNNGDNFSSCSGSGTCNYNSTSHCDEVDTFDAGSYGSAVGSTYSCGIGGGGGGYCGDGICNNGETSNTCPSDCTTLSPDYSMSMTPSSASALQGTPAYFTVTLSPSN